MSSHYLTAEEAAAALGVSVTTLYAYASRGQLRAEPMPGKLRASRYYREDIERLRERKQARTDPSRAAARGLHWGSPVLDSGITLISDGRYYYRGRDAARLAETATLEEVAAVLWDTPAQEQGLLPPCPLPPSLMTRVRACSNDPLTRMEIALPLAVAADPTAYDLRTTAVRRCGGRILRLWTALIAGAGGPRKTHSALQSAWAPRQPEVADALRTALVLCADHELNASAFTARCAASAGATPYDAIAAAMATLKGRRHGGGSERAAALLAEAKTPAGARRVVRTRLRHGEAIPGFGHPLYPAGDPRAVLLLRLAEAGPAAPLRVVRAFAKAASEAVQELPNLDFGLAALAYVYGLPASAPLIMFALGRTVGWIAHAIEQYSSPELIRPRARYTGPPVSISERDMLDRMKRRGDER